MPSDGEAIRDNGVEIEAELNIHLLTGKETGGWVSSHVDVVDQFSPAHQPAAGSVFTHKLDFEWDTASTSSTGCRKSTGFATWKPKSRWIT